jgi:predicted Fe-Mo cluster-binding NifX family protein
MWEKPSVAAGLKENEKRRAIPSVCGEKAGKSQESSATSRRKEKVMKVGFAVQNNEGMESKVYDHFGSAPAFIIADTEGKEVVTIDNKDLHHVHGACNPVMALDGKSVDAMVVGGIGAGALMKLNASGIKVYGAGAPTVKENLSLLSENKLQELSVNNSCRAHQGGCGH